MEAAGKAVISFEHLQNRRQICYRLLRSCLTLSSSDRMLMGPELERLFGEIVTLEKP